MTNDLQELVSLIKSYLKNGTTESLRKLTHKLNELEGNNKDMKAQMKQLFLNNESGYYWTAKDATALNQIITKIKYVLKESGADINEESILKSYKVILSNPPDWCKDTYTLPLINSQFNNIIKHLKNGKVSKIQQQAARIKAGGL